jgi:hypothetical protein
MKQLILGMPTLAFIVATRAALGVGVGLLASRGMPESRRRAVGATLVAIGAATTIPALYQVARGRQRSRSRRGVIAQDRRLIGVTRLPRRGDEITADTVW